MHKNISGTIFYSLLFAMGGAPTIAMMIIRSQIVDESIVYQVFMGLSVMIACILVPLILIQNAYLFIKRKDVKLENKLKPWSQTYFVLNIFCLIFWISYQFVY